MSLQGLQEAFTPKINEAFMAYQNQIGTKRIIYSFLLQINLTPWIAANDLQNLNQYEPCRLHLINSISPHQASLKLIPVIEVLIATFSKRKKQIKVIGVEIISKVNYQDSRKRGGFISTIRNTIQGCISFESNKWVCVPPFFDLCKNLADQKSSKIFTLSEDVFSLKTALSPHLEKLFTEIIATLSETILLPSLSLTLIPELENGPLSEAVLKERITLLDPLVENSLIEQLFKRFSTFAANFKEPFKWVTYKIEIITSKVAHTEAIPPINKILPITFKGQLIMAPGGLWFDQQFNDTPPPPKKSKVETPFLDLNQIFHSVDDKSPILSPNFFTN